MRHFRNGPRVEGGTAIATAISWRHDVSSRSSWKALAQALFAVGAAVLVGLVFGTYRALRAAALIPIDAIARE